MPAELRFEAMGTWAHVTVVGGPVGAVHHARRRIEELESRWSRFRPGSEVSRLNAAAGRPVVVSADTATLVDLALSGWRGTGGRFDPTVLGAVVDAGYDRSFEQVGDGDGGGPSTASGLSTGATAVAVDVRVGTVALPPGVGFDPGGIGKGLAADLVVAELLAAGAAGTCVNLGGDLRAEGDGPWAVDVADPFDGGDGRRPPIARLVFDGGGVATSSTRRRAWWRGDDRRHHVIDPGTGRSAATGVAAATVLTGDAWRAEVLAKAALLAGVADGIDLLASAGATGLLVDDEGDVHLAPGIEPFLA